MSAAKQEAGRKLRVLVTRASGQTSALADVLQSLGAEPICVPTIEVVEPDSFEQIDAALRNLPHFHWLLFTSANGVQALVTRAENLGAAPNFTEVKIAAIGSATARALASFGLKADLIPPTAVAESLAEALAPFARQEDGCWTRFLLVRGQEGRDFLPETLRSAGGEITVVAAYKTQMPSEGMERLRECFTGAGGAPDGITLTSSSAAQNFFALLSAAKLELGTGTAIASIGPVTSATLRELGHPPHVEAREASVQALAEAMLDFLGTR